ncbi:class I adenylate-forming enzyme family protein [Halovivax gelatinilyticus]|uniref:class I adenylate-forming enzyme family protein n=1 Tax=Halovivax gelatinilyticus TaxID=2961597 RepID=UPI0020CA8E5C|nr:class I adenylate-forming enzyme family protein [Halovivax gelatinilyticus]
MTTHFDSVVDLVTTRTAATPDRLAMIDGLDGRRWTYRQLDLAVDAIAADLDAVATDRVAVVCPPGPSFVQLAFAAMRRGVTLVPLAPDESSEELRPKVEQAAPDAIVCTGETESTAVDLGSTGGGIGVHRLSELIDSDESIPFGGSVDTGADDVSGVHEAVHSPELTTTSTSAPIGDPVSLDPDWVQLICFTSGTSGRPKGVKLTVSNLLESANASAYRLGVDPSDRWLVPLPMHHMGGFAPVIRSARYGTAVVPLRSSEPDRIAGAVSTYACTGISLVPTMLRRLIDLGWEPPDSLRFVLVGGAPTPPALVERALGAGVPIYPTYGATETSSQVATATPSQVSTSPDTVGQPLVGTTVRIVDDEGSPVEPGGTGELLVGGPTVSSGYLDATQTDRSFADGWFVTGDLGHRDDAGRLWVTGRRSDRIVTGGETVDPAEVRRVLCDHPAVIDAAVVGLPDETWGERVGAVVVVDDRSLSAESVRSFCRDRLATAKRPRTIAFVDDLPRTHSGTIDRDAVRRRLRDV